MPSKPTERKKKGRTPITKRLHTNIDDKKTMMHFARDLKRSAQEDNEVFMQNKQNKKKQRAYEDEMTYLARALPSSVLDELSRLLKSRECISNSPP